MNDGLEPLRENDGARKVLESLANRIDRFVAGQGTVMFSPFGFPDATSTGNCRARLHVSERLQE